MEDDTWAREGWTGDIHAAKAAEAAQQGHSVRPSLTETAALVPELGPTRRRAEGAEAGPGSKGSSGGMPEAQARDADQQALISQSGGNTAAGNSAGAKAASAEGHSVREQITAKERSGSRQGRPGRQGRRTI